MGHKVRLVCLLIRSAYLLFVFQQWYRRRKSTVDCYVGNKFSDPVEHEDNCECTDIDYEWQVA